MKHVPHFNWLIVLYFVMVAVPVYGMHTYLKSRIQRQRSAPGLLLYFLAVAGMAVVMHFLSIWIYFTFFFRVSN